MSWPCWPRHFFDFVLRLWGHLANALERRACHEEISHIPSRAGDRSRRRADVRNYCARIQKRPSAAPRRAARHQQRHSTAAAGRCRHRTRHRHCPGQARLYGDRRHAHLLQPVRRPKRGSVLHRLYRERRGPKPAADLRVQWRARCCLGVSASRPGRSAHSRFRAGQPRRIARGLARQSRHLAQIHRSGADRSDRHRLEPCGQGGRRQGLLEHSERRRCHGESDCALRRAQRPHRIAKIFVRRELWRLPRRQDGARAAARPGHRDLRHCYAVADAGRMAHLRRRRFRAARGAEIAVAGGCRARAQE